MRKHDAASADTAAMAFELGIVDVEVDLRIPVATLAEEQIDVRRATHELLRPAGIAGVEDGLPLETHLQPERRLALLVRDGEWLDRHAADLDVRIGGQRLKADRIGRRPRGGPL